MFIIGLILEVRDTDCRKILNVGKYIPLYYLQKRIFIIFKDIFDYSIMCNINKFRLSILSQILLSIIVV